jgi:mannose-6-phosphate isomerase-like protein (cupin superfamily)
MKSPRTSIGRLAKVAAKRSGPLTIKTLTKMGMPMTVLHISLSPGSKAPALYHARTQEFFFVLKGNAHGLIDGRRVRLPKGSFSFLPPRAVHQFWAGANGAEILDIFVPPLDPINPDIIAA